MMSSEKNLRRSEIQVSVGTTLPDTNVNAGSRGIWGGRSQVTSEFLG